MAGRMRTVLVATTVHNPKDNRILFKQIGSLCDAGWTVHYLCRRDGHPDPGDRLRIIPVSIPGNRLLRMIVGNMVLLWKGLFSDARILHVHDPELFLVARMLGWRFHRVILDLHELPHEQARYKPYLVDWLKRPVSVVVEWALRVILFRATMVIAESSYANWTMQYAQEAILVRNFPIASRLPAIAAVDRSGSPEFRIAYVGVIARERSMDMVAGVLPEIAAAIGRRTTLRLVGGFESRQLESEIRACEGVEYHGYLPNEEALALISRTDVGIALTARMPNFDHSLATKIPEYIALGLPVVASDNPVNRELFGDFPTVQLVDPASREALIEAIVSLVKQPVSVEVLHRARERVINEMNWSVEFAKLLDFYEAAAGTGR